MRTDKISTGQATIIDVRTPEEFRDGHLPGAVNIPVHELRERLEEVRSLNTPLLLCCASGARSNMALQFLRSNGIRNVEDGGGWRDLQFRLKQTEG